MVNLIVDSSGVLVCVKRSWMILEFTLKITLNVFYIIKALEGAIFF